MKALILLSCCLCFACQSVPNQQEEKANPGTSTISIDSTLPSSKPAADTVTGKTYSNERFKDVTVEKIDDHSFRVKGKAQVFEATFGWEVEDGHQVLKKGFETTDAGAPAWGNFSFTVDVQKRNSESMVHLLLFVASAKDGSRQYELPVRLNL